MNKIKFCDLKNCDTFLKFNITKSSAGHQRFCDSLTTPYQGLYIDFRFSGQIFNNRDCKIIEEPYKYIDGFNGEKP